MQIAKVNPNLSVRLSRLSPIAASTMSKGTSMYGQKLPSPFEHLNSAVTAIRNVDISLSVEAMLCGVSNCPGLLQVHQDLSHFTIFVDFAIRDYCSRRLM